MVWNRRRTCDDAAVASALELRPGLRAQRAGIAVAHDQRSAQLADTVLSHRAISRLEPGDWVTCYSSYRDEPPTRELLRRLCAKGLAVLVPAVHGENLHWHDVTGEVDDPAAWTRDSYGIPRPRTPEVATTAHELLALGVRVIITPGLGMERSGARIGQGGGFYDRFFAQWPRYADGGPFRLGITHFGGILVDGTIDLLPHDEPIDDALEG